MVPEGVAAGISFEELCTGLRGWASGRARPWEIAAVDLLIWKETWLRRPDFTSACMTQRAAGLVAVIHWDEAREFIDRGYAARGQRPPPAASSERRVLDLAVALGEDMFGIAGFGHAHRRKAAEAFAAACGERLAPEVAHHNHPDFIPGDKTCRACALERESSEEGNDDAR